MTGLDSWKKHEFFFSIIYRLNVGLTQSPILKEATALLMGAKQQLKLTPLST